jgi:2-oxoglutarate dehydrogenase E2 component (dihydrolipoamide succinyltransferase)
LTQILVQEGETVEVGTKLGQIGGSAGGAVSEPAPEPVATQAAAQEADAPSSAETPQPVAPTPATPTPAAPTPPAPTPAAPTQSNGNSGAFVSPVVARIAAEHNVDPGQISGTGRGGRVTKKDILGFIGQGGAQQQQQQAPPEPPQQAAPAPAPAQAPSAPAPPAPPQPAAAPAAPAEAQAGEQLEPVTAMRRGIAEHMRKSLDTSAHVTSAIEVDMSRVVAARNVL